MGFGIINFVFSFPAVWTIDTLGRRTLLLLTFPLMALFQGFIAIALGVQNESSQPAVLLVGIYLFIASYSPGEGPVPFVSFSFRNVVWELTCAGVLSREHASLQP